MNYDQYLSETGSLRRQSPLHHFSNLAHEITTPLINMSPGLPNSDLFFLTGAKFQLSDGSTVELTKEDMRVAQAYSNSEGIKPLHGWLRELTIKLHSPPTLDASDEGRALQVIVNTGGCNGITSAAGLVLNRGSKCLVFERIYPTFLEGLRVIGADPLPIKLEEDGPDMAHFRQVLSQWTPDDKEHWATRPKAFYMVPNGNNPSGETVSLDKRRQIYALAREYNFIIIEDDAYFFMQYDEPRLPSFLSLDVDGRVIRVDSFAKVIGAGFRLGWVSGPKALVTSMMYETQVYNQHANVLSQVLFYRMFEKWGIDGFLKRTDDIKEFYKRRRDIVAKAAEDHLTGLATWTVPNSGMFMWMKLLAIKNSEQFLAEKMLKRGVLFTPGNIFLVDQPEPSSFMRVSFSCCPEDELAEGLKRLAETIKEVSSC